MARHATCEVPIADTLYWVVFSLRLSDCTFAFRMTGLAFWPSGYASPPDRYLVPVQQVLYCISTSKRSPSFTVRLLESRR
jgi:hypothetical protein